MARYCFSDLHGSYDLWQKIKEYIKPEDEVYCLGDCADRGPDGLKIMLEVMAMSQITYIKGNHEDLLVEAYTRGDWDSWYWNGGKVTNLAMKEEFDEQTLMEFITKIRKLPTRVDIQSDMGNIILTHAGCDPWKFNFVDDYIWDRNHIYSGWIENSQFDDTYVVHGHTPTPLEEWEWVTNEPMDEHDPKIVVYADGHKVCIDTGAVWTGTAVLFDLDTFTPIYLKREEN